jgi:type II secretory ATPase GspE/PulE/Tfp pilus assembly ATPase PilB-like protein
MSEPKASAEQATPEPATEPADGGANALAISVANLPPDETVWRLIEHGAALGISDLFLLTRENHVAVQARHLGILRLVTLLSPDMGRRCMAHIKALAGMDVAEKRRPQDGRWIFRGAGGASPVDLRISIIPTLHGEDITLRLLPRALQLLALDNLGMLQPVYNQLLGLINKPGGLLLVTGPTGAGKTTTLYACLTQLTNGERKINTIEDPIEYALPGVRQSQVNPLIEVGFPELLRSVLRQAPDVIMVGEIRDPVTADTAVRAAASGHLVLATLHAPVAAGAIQSLLSLGVHPHFLGSSLLGVVAQRLVRTLCRECRQGFDVSDSPHSFDEVKRWLQPGDGQSIYAPNGCTACRGIGYSGRSGVFEVLVVSPAVRHLILQRETTQSIHQKALEEGMIAFRQSALLKVAQGQTSLEEVMRAVPVEPAALED